ncbi:PTS fructose-like transporter subunit IIB [Clostridium tertium]
MKVVGVTSCPSGVAHTYMAAEALVLAGKKYGVEVIIETQGGAGIENRLKLKDIEEAVCVILTNDISIKDEDRFKGKKVIKMGVSDVIKRSDAIILKIKDKFKE